MAQAIIRLTAPCSDPGKDQFEKCVHEEHAVWIVPVLGVSYILTLRKDTGRICQAMQTLIYDAAAAPDKRYT